MENNSVAAEKRCGGFVSVQDGQKWSEGEGEVHSELSTPPTSKLVKKKWSAEGGGGTH